MKSGKARALAARTRRAGTLALAIGLGGVAAVSQAALSAKASPSTTGKHGAAKHRSWSQIGKASWYGGKFQGRRTALGVRYDMNALTCAHRTLPLGSWVRVTNLHNKREVFLRVTDRGPYAENVIADLSLAAARMLGIGGLGSVKLEAVSRETAMAAQKPRELRAVYEPRLEMASNEYGVPILPPVIADR